MKKFYRRDEGEESNESFFDRLKKAIAMNETVTVGMKVDLGDLLEKRTEAEKKTDAESVRFLVRHITEYSMHGKSLNRDGMLIWSLTGELCGDPEGDRKHFEKVAEMLRDLKKYGDQP